jgi:polysaccharide pyruvyl transferase CsaB
LAKPEDQQILIGGYYGFGNLGDEAVLEVLLKLLRKSFPGVRPVVLSQDPRATAHAHGVDSISRWNPWLIWRRLRRARLFLLGGGSLLQDSTSRRSLLYYLELIRWAQRHQKPVFLVGQGIGPLQWESSRRRVARALANVEAILARDRESYQQLRALGLDRERLLCGEDLGHLLEYPRSRSSQGRAREPYYCAVLKEGLSQAQIRNLAANFDRIYSESGQRALLLPFYRLRDWPTLQALARAMRTPVELAHPVGLDPKGVYQIMGGSEFVIGMRLHSLIFALTAQVPFAAVNYDPKVERFVARVQMACGIRLPLWNLNDLDRVDIAHEIGWLRSARDELAQKLALAHEQLTHGARAGWQEICERMKPHLGAEAR